MSPSFEALLIDARLTSPLAAYAERGTGGEDKRRGGDGGVTNGAESGTCVVPAHSFGTILRLAKSPSEPFPTHNPTRPLAR